MKIFRFQRLLAIGATILLTKGAAAGMGAFGEAIQFRWEATAVVAGFAVVIGFVSALAPAIFAARRNIVESLRFTG